MRHPGWQACAVAAGDGRGREGGCCSAVGKGGRGAAGRVWGCGVVGEAASGMEGRGRGGRSRPVGKAAARGNLGVATGVFSAGDGETCAGDPRRMQASLTCGFSEV